MKPGIYKDISIDAYHSGPGLSSSNLKQLLKSGLHYQTSLTTETEQSAEMRLGSLVHLMILEPDRVQDQVYVGDFNTRRGKDFDIACKEGGNKLICNREEFERAQECAEAFRLQATSHPFFNGEKFKLLDGLKEHSFYWKDPATGLLLKARPDNIHPEGVIVDLKTCRDASPDGFQKAIAEYHYHLSAAHYLDGVNSLGTSACAFAFVCIETKAPYAMATYYLSAEAIELGREQCRIAVETYAKGETTGQWEAYPKKLVEVSLPNWYFHRQKTNRGINE